MLGWFDLVPWKSSFSLMSLPSILLCMTRRKKVYFCQRCLFCIRWMVSILTLERLSFISSSMCVHSEVLFSTGHSCTSLVCGTQSQTDHGVRHSPTLSWLFPVEEVWQHHSRFPYPREFQYLLVLTNDTLDTVLSCNGREKKLSDFALDFYSGFSAPP